MASTTKESMPADISRDHATRDAAESGSQSPHGAVGEEVPVAVHASRTTVTARGATKRPTPIHEETHTVIVFPHGAVVRLSATVTPGEMVVLTNRRNGADVICRVVEVKAQPDIQSYVNLEFMQRAPGFWGQCLSEEPSAVPPPPPPVIASPVPSPDTSSVERTPLRQTIAPVPAAEPTPEVPAAAAPERPATLPAPPEPPAMRPRPFTAGSSGSLLGTEITPLRETQTSPRPFAPQFPGSEPASGSKKVLFGVAASVLLAIAATAGVMLRHQEFRRAPDPPAASVPQNAALQPEAALPQQAPEPEPAASPAIPAPAETAANPSGTEPATPHAARPARKSVQRTPAPHPASHRPRINVAKLQAPILKTHQGAAVSQPPEISAAPGGTNLLDTVQVQSDGPGVAPAPVQGGQIEQPRLIASMPPAYPALARTQNVQGVVVLDALVDATGKVATTKVLSGPGLLRNAATSALHSWKYRPARLNGQPIAMHIQVHINFRLR